MAKTAPYIVTTADDTKVGERTEGKAADKLAEKLTAETGQVHRVYTPTNRLRLETEVIEAEPADEVPAVDINEDVVEEHAETPAAEDEPEAQPEESAESAEEPVEDVEPEAPTEEVPAEEAPAPKQPKAKKSKKGKADAPTDEAIAAARAATGFVSYATLQDQLKSDDNTVSDEAAREWAFRLDVYKKRTNAKDESERIVGPAMAAALERGSTTDGRTVASLAKRGLVVRGDGLDFTVNEAGKAALAAAIAAVAPIV